MEIFSNKYAEFWIEDGILYFVYGSSIILNLAVAEKVVTDRLKFQAERYYPIYCDTRGIVDTEKEARDFLAKEGSLLTSAVAFVVNPSFSQAIAKFYIRTNKPIIPSEIFTEEQEAIKFLRPFRKKLS